MTQKAVVIVALFAVAAAVDVARGIPYPFPGFWAAFGLAGAALLILVAKGVLKGLLQRPEEYYERGGRG